MVTTTSLSPDLNFLVGDLLHSGLDEDQELAQKAGETLVKLVEKLKPILHYIAVPARLKEGGSGKFIIVIGQDGVRPALVLRQDCQWGQLFRTEDDEKTEFRELPFVWQNYLFSSIIESLKYILETAEAKRKEHLEAITKRREMLDNIMKIVEGAE